MVEIGAVSSVARYELHRESSKRTVWLAVLLMALPVVAALILRSRAATRVQDPMLWSTVMGYSVTGGSLEAVGAGVLSVISWGWLIALLFGGDLYSSDIADGTLAMILARPVSRLDYLLGKAVAAVLLMIAVFLAGGLSVFAAAWIIGGPQEGLWEILLLSSLTGIGASTLQLLSAWFGLKFGKPVLGYILGFLSYFISSIAIGIATVFYIYMGSDPETGVRLMNLLRAYIPISEVGYLASAVFSNLHPEMHITLVTSQGPVTLNPPGYAGHAGLGVTLWLVGLIAAAWLTLRRMDV